MVFQVQAIIKKRRENQNEQDVQGTGERREINPLYLHFNASKSKILTATCFFMIMQKVLRDSLFYQKIKEKKGLKKLQLVSAISRFSRHPNLLGSQIRSMLTLWKLMSDD